MRFECGAPDGQCETTATCGAQGFCGELARVSSWGQCRRCGNGRPLDGAGNVRTHGHYTGKTFDPWSICQGSGRPPADGTARGAVGAPAPRAVPGMVTLARDDLAAVYRYAQAFDVGDDPAMDRVAGLLWPEHDEPPRGG